MPRAGTENFLTLKELLSSFKSHLNSMQINCKPALGWPPSAFEQWERGLHPKCIDATLCSCICYLLGTQIFISRLVIYNRFKWPVCSGVCKQTCQWDGSEGSGTRASGGIDRAGPIHLISQVELFQWIVEIQLWINDSSTGS